MTDSERAQWRAEAVAIFRGAIDAVNPTRLVAHTLARRGHTIIVESGDRIVARWRPPTVIIGAGKGAARMAAGCEQALGHETVRGEVIVADGCRLDLTSIRVTEAGHPTPDRRGEEATRRLIELIDSSQVETVLCLVSGGASSLLVCPRPPLTLDDKVRTTRLLLECGADIGEMNTVRKHLSQVKGGGLLRRVRGRVVGLLISDVVGDDLSTIGSGPTVPDPTTFAAAWAVLDRYHLTATVPPAVADVLRRGLAGEIPETVKPGDPEAERGVNLILGSNRVALEGAAQAARARGWTVRIEDAAVAGDTTEAAVRFARRLGELVRRRDPRRPLCVLAGGETTVRVKGTGRGGRNQEFALVLAGAIAGQDVLVLSAGTDGIDGPTDAAGAFVDGTTLQRARACGADADTALAENDSHTFFARLGDLFRCGPTGTNVMDVKIALVAAPR